MADPWAAAADDQEKQEIALRTSAMTLGPKQDSKKGSSGGGWGTRQQDASKQGIFPLSSSGGGSIASTFGGGAGGGSSGGSFASAVGPVQFGTVASSPNTSSWASDGPRLNPNFGRGWPEQPPPQVNGQSSGTSTNSFGGADSFGAENVRRGGGIGRGSPKPSTIPPTGHRPGGQGFEAKQPASSGFGTGAKAETDKPTTNFGGTRPIRGSGFGIPPTQQLKEEDSWDSSSSPTLVASGGPPSTGFQTSPVSKTKPLTPTSPFAGQQDVNASTDSDDKPMDKAEISLLNKIVHKKLEDLGGRVEIKNLQQDPSSPLFSLKSFEELRLAPELIKGVYAMGFSQPSKIQEAALPILLVEPPQNLIAQSQSGTGKTAAFVLTMLQRIDTKLRMPQCLCLAPTYELALQIGKVVEEMGKFLTGLGVRYAVRGNRVARGQRIEEQIVIGTPGTVMDWVIKLRVIDPTSIRVFVLDEADVMISQQGHQDQSVRIHQALTQAGNNCQMLLFSATYDEAVMQFAESIIPNACALQLRREEQTLDTIKQYVVHCESPSDKFDAICNLYSGISIGNCIIFCATRASASWISRQMASKGHKVALLSGELEIDQRALVIKEFKEGTYRVLITTNVCARGIDVSTVTIVINYDLPMVRSEGPWEPDYDVYLHRIGRTGRFGKQGIAINLVDGPRTRDNLHKIEQYFGRKIEKLDTRDDKALEAIEQE